MNEMSDAKQQPPISKVQEGCDNRGFVMEAMKRWSVDEIDQISSCCRYHYLSMEFRSKWFC